MAKQILVQEITPVIDASKVTPCNQNAQAAEPARPGRLLRSSSSSGPALSMQKCQGHCKSCTASYLGHLTLMIKSSRTHPNQYPHVSKPPGLWSAVPLFPGRAGALPAMLHESIGLTWLPFMKTSCQDDPFKEVTAQRVSVFSRLLQRNLHARQLLGMLFLAALQQTKTTNKAGVHPIDSEHVLWQLLLCVQSRSCQDWTSTCVWLEPILPKLSQYLWATCTHHQSTHDTWYCTSFSLFNPLWPFGCFGGRGSRDVIYSELTGWNPTPAVLQDQLVTAVRPPLEKKIIESQSWSNPCYECHILSMAKFHLTSLSTTIYSAASTLIAT